MNHGRLCEAVEIASGQTVALRFLKQHGPFLPGEVYRIKVAAADRLVDGGIAELELVEEPEEEPAPKRKKAGR